MLIPCQARESFGKVMKKSKIFFVIFFSFLLLVPFVCKAQERQCVILLHGLARSHYAMSSLASSLKLHNYVVINDDYPSTKKPIEELADQYIPSMVDKCLTYHAKHINFVTHSLGGIILQEYLQNHEIPKLSRIIMLGPPNHGSQLADLLHNNWLFKIITGPAGQELTTQKTSIPNQLHLNQQYQIGIIAGNFSLIPFGSFIFHEENDGKVTVSSAKTDKMKDFIVLPVSHTFMMRNSIVQEQILNFLNCGKFVH